MFTIAQNIIASFKKGKTYDELRDHVFDLNYNQNLNLHLSICRYDRFLISYKHPNLLAIDFISSRIKDDIIIINNENSKYLTIKITKNHGNP